MQKKMCIRDSHKDDADGDRQRREAIDALPELFFFHKLTLSASAYPPSEKIAPERIGAVSYTHLDVYKRQPFFGVLNGPCPFATIIPVG